MYILYMLCISIEIADSLQCSFIRSIACIQVSIINKKEQQKLFASNFQCEVKDAEQIIEGQSSS